MLEKDIYMKKKTTLFNKTIFTMFSVISTKFVFVPVLSSASLYFVVTGLHSSIHLCISPQIFTVLNPIFLKVSASIAALEAVLQTTIKLSFTNLSSSSKNYFQVLFSGASLPTLWVPFINQLPILLLFLHQQLPNFFELELFYFFCCCIITSFLLLLLKLFDNLL